MCLLLEMAFQLGVSEAFFPLLPGRHPEALCSFPSQ